MQTTSRAPDFQDGVLGGHARPVDGDRGGFSRPRRARGAAIILRQMWGGTAEARRDARLLGLDHPTGPGQPPDEAAGLRAASRIRVTAGWWLMHFTESGRSLEVVIAAETDKLTERGAGHLGPAERDAVIRARAAIRAPKTSPDPETRQCC